MTGAGVWHWVSAVGAVPARGAPVWAAGFGRASAFHALAVPPSPVRSPGSDPLVGGLASLLGGFGDLGLSLLWLPALLAAVLTAALTIVGQDQFGVRLRQPMASSFKWDASSSWASILTAAGALLGTVLTTGIIPDTPARLSKDAFALYNVLFGALILVPPLVFNALHSPRVDQGRVWTFLLGCWITLTAVFGELITLLFLIPEVADRAGLSITVLWIFVTLNVLIILLVARYGWVTIYRLLLREQASHAHPRGERHPVHHRIAKQSRLADPRYFAVPSQRPAPAESTFSVL